MPAIEFSLTVHLESYDLDDVMRPAGPVFHEWLPDGETDRVRLATEAPEDELAVWFERRGKVRGSFIEYDKSAREVNEGLLRRQAKLDAGQLWGAAWFTGLSEDELTAVRDGTPGSPGYTAAGKKVVRFLFPPLSAFIERLRTQFGQYWIPPLYPWDSRTQSLGSYCARILWLEWRTNPEEEWKVFRPTEGPSTLIVESLPGRGYKEFHSCLLKASPRRSAGVETGFSLRGCGRALAMIS